MKVKRTESTIKPNDFEIRDRKGSLIEVAFFDDIKEETRTSEDETEQVMYTYYTYTLQIVYRDDIEEYIEENLAIWKELAKNNFIATKAAEIRALRDKLLAESDSHVLLDRAGFNLPNSISATTMLSAVKDFFSTLKDLVNGDWAEYRQKLRDITKQPNFPFDVDFPTSPGEEDNK